MKRTLAVLATALALTFVLAAGASAATISDLQALGYTVGLATQCETPVHAWLNVWNVSGFGMSTYLSECDPDFQATVDSIANPVGHCNRVWQFTYPEQVDPEAAIERQGWTVTGDRCADTFTVTNPNDQSVRYSGPGAGIVALAASIGTPPAATPPVATPPPPVTPPAATPTVTAMTTAPAQPIIVNVTVNLTTTGPTAADITQAIADAVATALKAMQPQPSPAARPPLATPAASPAKAPLSPRARRRSSRRVTAAQAPQPLSRRVREGPPPRR